jgi:hypothetical protein
MAEPPADQDSDDAPTPRWVKRLGIAAIIFILVFAVVHLLGGGLGHHLHGGHASPPHGVEHP